MLYLIVCALVSSMTYAMESDVSIDDDALLVAERSKVDEYQSTISPDTLLIGGTLFEMVVEKPQVERVRLARKLGNDATKKKAEKEEELVKKKATLQNVAELLAMSKAFVESLYKEIQQEIKRVEEKRHNLARLTITLEALNRQIATISTSQDLRKTFTVQRAGLERNVHDIEQEIESIYEQISIKKKEAEAQLQMCRELTTHRNTLRDQADDVEAKVILINEGLLRLGMHYKGSVDPSEVVGSFKDHQQAIEQEPDERAEERRLDLERRRRFNRKHIEEQRTQSSSSCILL